MKCPKCNDEYCDDIEICADCLVQLVPDEYQGELEEQMQPQNENDTMTLIDEVCEHLEFLGFKLQPEENILKATHNKLNWDVYLIEYANGIIFEVCFKVHDKVNDSKEKYLEFINQCNNDIPVIRVFHNFEDEKFIINAWFPGNYDKMIFENYINRFLEDISIISKKIEFSNFIDS